MADKYEIVNNVIRPCSDATFEYRALWRADGGSESFMPDPPPYVALFDAVSGCDRFRAGPRRSRRLDLKSKERILNWCHTYGLLGVLPQKAMAYSPVGESAVHTWAGRWIRMDSGPEPGTATLGRFQRRNVAFTEPEWYLHFPYVSWHERRTFPYPSPQTGSFWAEYGEPAETFIANAVSLRDSLRVAGSSKTRAATDPPPSAGAWQLTGLLSSMGIEVGFTADATPALFPVSPSLIASLGWLAVQDMTGGSVRVCKLPECRRIYRAEHWKQLYCTQEEQWRFNKRAQRAPEKESSDV